MNRLIAALALILACSLAGNAQVKPCSLVTPAEVESALGVKVTGLDVNGEMGGMATCSGVAANRMSVMVMFAGAGAQKGNGAQKGDDAKWADPLGELERQSRESAKSIGAQMEVKRFGSSILCTTLIPPKQGPYSTQCMAVKKPTGMGSISVLVRTQQDMVPIEKLRPLAEKMLGRL
jgi:hypothetical protein